MKRTILIFALLLCLSHLSANADSSFCEDSDSVAQNAIQLIQLPLDSLVMNSNRDYASCMLAAGQASGAINVSFNLLSARNAKGCYKDARVIRDALNSIEQVKQTLTSLCYRANSQAMLVAISNLREDLSAIH